MIELCGKTYGPGNPMVVAEIGPNHNGQFDLAVRLVEEAAKAGADAVKFQVYEPSDLTVESSAPHFMIPDGPWKGSLWDLYMRAQTSIIWIPALAEVAKDHGIGWFCSVFNPEVVKELERFGCPAYKIASPEAEWPELLGAVAKTGKPVIVSDGMLSLFDADVIRDEMPGAIILRCVSEYPASADSYGFQDKLEALNDDPWGISDHSLSLVPSVVAASLGACVVEAHLKLSYRAYFSHDLPLDDDHSMGPERFAEYASSVREAAKMAHSSRSERSDAPWRRRLVWSGDRSVGHVVTPTDLLCVRASAGRSPRYMHGVVGRTLAQDVKRHHPVSIKQMERRPLVNERMDAR